MLAQDCGESKIINLIKSDPNYSFPEGIDRKCVLESEIIYYYHNPDVELFILEKSRRIYVLHAESRVEFFEFYYGKVKKILEKLPKWDELILEDIAMYMLLKVDYRCVHVNKKLKMMPWMRDFLSQHLNKSMFYDDGTDENIPLLSVLIITYGWDEMKKILDMYEKVNDNLLVNNVWYFGHPLFYIPEEDKYPIWQKYFSNKFKYEFFK